VLSIIAGGGMSSRLFQEVREKRGLAYTISSFTSSYSDSGIFGVYSGTAESNANELIDVICTELLKLTNDIKSEELMRAKAQVRAGLLMSQESSVARAEKLAGNYAAYGRYIPTSEVIEKIEAIELADITRFAKHMLTQKALPTLVSIGKVDKVFTLDDVVKKLEL
jgi:predicted Zn-dependent peptidase